MIPHTSVLLNEVLSAFDSNIIHKKDAILIDCTFGYGGHSLALMQKYPNLKIIGIDQDKSAIALAKERLRDFDGRYSICFGNFSEEIAPLLKKHRENIIGILADIGVSSMQFDDKERGFSFFSENLDMRMNTQNILNAKEIINGYSKPELERIFRDYGEIREYKKVADLIINERKKCKIKSANFLSELIAKHFKHPKIHPATQAFQALRIEVNNELNVLEKFLDSIDAMPQDSRLAIISFHSLEDRIIKQKFKQWEKSCICPNEALRCTCKNNHQKGKILNKKPITPSNEEIKNNPRSRSAKLRVFSFKGQ